MSEFAFSSYFLTPLDKKMGQTDALFLLNGSPVWGLAQESRVNKLHTAGVAAIERPG